MKKSVHILIRKCLDTHTQKKKKQPKPKKAKKPHRLNDEGNLTS